MGAGCSSSRHPPKVAPQVSLTAGSPAKSARASEKRRFSGSVAHSDSSVEDTLWFRVENARTTMSDTGYSTPDDGSVAAAPPLTIALLEEHERQLLERNPQLQPQGPMPSRQGSIGEPSVAQISGADLPDEVQQPALRIAGHLRSRRSLKCTNDDEGYYPPTAETIAAGMAIVGAPPRYPPTQETIEAGIATVG